MNAGQYKAEQAMSRLVAK